MNPSASHKPGEAGASPCLAAAISYAARGWRVLPLHTPTEAGTCSCGAPDCRKPGKHPRTVHGVKDATTDEATIRAWWARCPDANIGIATGERSGLVVVDIDDNRGGMESLHYLETQHGDLPATPVVRTGNGIHLYFRHPGTHLKNSVGRDELQGIDLRGDGGYVVAPPSLHCSGKRYEWEKGPDRERLAEVPDWLLTLLSGVAQSADGSRAPGGGQKIPEGLRNTTLTSLAGTMHRRGMTPSAIDAALLEENEARCDPPLPAAEVATIARSVTRYPVSANTGNSAKEASVEACWEPPVAFDEFDLPPFPTEALAAPLRAFVEAVATATQTPPDLSAMLVLSAVAAATGRKVRIQVKEGYSEPLNIFTVTALPPANRKSQVFADVTAPLVTFEREEAARMAPEIFVAQGSYEIALKKLKVAQGAAAKSPDDPLKTRTADDLARDLAGIKVPTSPRLIADDTTPEKLASMLHDQDGRMAVLSAEGGVFDLMAGRYSQNGAPNFEVYLKGHAGDMLRVDRRTRPAEHVDRPALTLGLAVQPKVLEGLAGKFGFRGRGLLGRFLYSLPRSFIGHRNVDAPPVPPCVRAAYAECVTRLLRMTPTTNQSGLPEEHLLHLEDRARLRVREAELQIEAHLSEFGELGAIQEWGGKWFGAVCRVAGLLHIAEHADDPAPWNRLVSANTVDRAISVGLYLIPHAKAAYGIMGADPDVEAAKHILRWIKHRGFGSFSKRGAFEGTKGRFKKVGAMEPGIQLLIEHDYIRQRVTPERTGPGNRPSPVYDVNPHPYSQNSHDSQDPGPTADSANSANTASHGRQPASGPASGSTAEEDQVMHRAEAHEAEAGSTEAPSRNEPPTGDYGSPQACLVCRSTRFWRTMSGILICEVCHPPASPTLIARRVNLAKRNNRSTNGGTSDAGKEPQD